MEPVKLVYLVFLFKYGESIVFNHTTNVSLYNLIVYTDRDRALMYKYYMVESKVLFLNMITNQAAIPLKVLVEDRFRQSFERELNRRGIQYSYISQTIWKKYLQTNGEKYLTNPSRNFLTFDGIVKWAAQNKENYPKYFERLRLRHNTYENRQMLEMKVSKDLAKRTIIYVIGGENARDWMSTAVIINYIEKMLNILKLKDNSKQGTKGAKVKPTESLLDHYNLHFVPVANPDGYVHNMDVDRCWARNRKVHYNSTCGFKEDAVGVDVERNWGIGPLPRSETCNGIFQGSHSLSEAETASLFLRMNSLAKRIMAVVVVKGFGRMITIPYAQPLEETVNHDLMMHIIGEVTSKIRIQKNETIYYGTTETFLYNYSGNLADYVKKKLNIPVVFTVYLQRGERFIPNVDDIEILTDDFKTILGDIILLATDIYSPLFNSQTNNFMVLKIKSIVITISLLNYYHIKYIFLT